MKTHTILTSDNNCSVLEQRQIVSQMSHCDKHKNFQDTYECYLNVSKESHENKACLFA